MALFCNFFSSFTYTIAAELFFQKYIFQLVFDFPFWHMCCILPGTHWKIELKNIPKKVNTFLKWILKSFVDWFGVNEKLIHHQIRVASPISLQWAKCTHLTKKVISLIVIDENFGSGCNFPETKVQGNSIGEKPYPPLHMRIWRRYSQELVNLDS